MLIDSADTVKYSINDTDFSKDNNSKKVTITGIVKTENAINVEAEIDGVKWKNFKLVNFSKTQFTLMYWDKEKEKIYNYIIAISE